MGGTFDKALARGVWVQYAASSVGTIWIIWVGACTLLGPEGPGALWSSDCGVTESSGPIFGAGSLSAAGWVPPVL